VSAVYYTIAGVVLYLLADGILRRLEARAGRVFEHRTLVFFALLSHGARLLRPDPGPGRPGLTWIKAGPAGSRL
jgi:hypothetical protein